MIGIIVAAHGPLPNALLESCDMVLGELPQVAPVSLMPGDSLEGLVDRLRDAADAVETGEGVLILLDMFGGTPANATAFLSQQREHVRAVTGANLPMLLETFLARQTNDDLEALTTVAVKAGRDGVVNVVEAFDKFRREQSNV